MTRVAIIIINWNGKKLTENCLSCFEKINHSYEIVVVDNASTDDSVSSIKKNFPKIHLIQSDVNLGFAGGNNLGIKYCLDLGFEYLMLLNNDTLFTEDFVSPLVNVIKSQPDIGGIQPKVYFDHDRTIFWNAGGIFSPWIGLSKTIGEGKKDHGQFNKLKQVDWISGCCFLIKSSVLTKVGFLDEHFFMYHEDVDLSLRIRKSGQRLIFCPEAKIFHIAGASSKAKKKAKEGYVHPLMHYLNVRNRYFVIRKNVANKYLVTATLYHLILISLYLFYFIVRGRFTKAKAVLLGLRDGFDSITSMDLPYFKA